MAALKEMRIVFLGKTGDGKSSSGNTILGDSSSTKFKALSSPNSGTRECEVKAILRAGKEFKIMDTPGFFDTHMSHEDLKRQIVNCIALTAPGPHAFIIVLKVGRYTEHEKEIVAKITTSFGEDALKYSAVLFTYGDQLNEGKTIEQFVEQNEELKELVEKCGGGCHVIDNKYWNQEHEYRSNRVQVEKLLNTIEKMVRQNGGGCYTNEMLQAVEKEVEKKVEIVKNEKPKEMSTFMIWREASLRFMETFVFKNPYLTDEVLLGALLGIEKDVAAIASIFLTESLGNLPLRALFEGNQL